MKTTTLSATLSGNDSFSTRTHDRLGPTRLAFLAVLPLLLTGFVRAENSPIPFSQIGAKATADYQGDALGVAAIPDGARLRCGFQKLEGRATVEGLWLESTVPSGGEFRLIATTMHREVLESLEAPRPLSNDPAPWRSGPYESGPQSATLSRWCPCLAVSSEGQLPTTGSVSVEDRRVRFIRSGLTEEYSVSVDGVRQDFVIAERPAGAGDLRVELALTGARAEAAACGAKVIQESSGRALAYSRLRATDAKGQELKARLEVVSARRLAVRVVDANATYPVRIDPTFSDANWVSLNPGLLGADSDVRALAVDGSGNVYVGGDFTVIGNVIANHIAKWNGSTWSPLGSGMMGLNKYSTTVNALAVSGTNLYAGGNFTNAGGVTANCIAKWNGSAWSALGAGVDGNVNALAISGSTLYAGGGFGTAGEIPANGIAKWNGSSWSALAWGVDGEVYALAVNGSTLYAGGSFSMAGEISANCVAKWNGSVWSALGSGMKGSEIYSTTVHALAVNGTTLYAGGGFYQCGRGVGRQHCQMERQRLVGLGLGAKRPILRLCPCASRERDHPLRRGILHDGGWRDGPRHNQMERQCLVGLESRYGWCFHAGGERDQSLRWGDNLGVLL